MPEKAKNLTNNLHPSLELHTYDCVHKASSLTFFLFDLNTFSNLDLGLKQK